MYSMYIDEEEKREQQHVYRNKYYSSSYILSIIHGYTFTSLFLLYIYMKETDVGQANKYNMVCIFIYFYDYIAIEKRRRGKKGRRRNSNKD